MPKSFERLSWRVFNLVSGRKRANAIAVVVNIETLEVFPIPQDIEHIDYVSKILGITKEGFVENPLIAERIIPSLIEIELDLKKGELIRGVITGVSGLEIALRVRHSRTDLEKAHRLVKNYLLK